jgi:alpha-D-ribose 1-methylphosphonate 5-triphosphate synthase subunit PhnL
LPAQDDSLEDLGAAASALDDLEVDAHTIAWIERRETLPQLTALDVVDDCANAKKDRRARAGRRAVAEW